MEDCSEDDPDTEFNMGCILYKVVVMVCSFSC